MNALSNLLLTVIYVTCLGVELWALADCATRRVDAFVAAGKLTKPVWLAITGGAMLFTVLFGFMGLFGIAGIIAAIIYLVDVRPAVKEVQGGGPW